MMRIAIVLPHLELFGGVRRMLEFANRLGQRGHAVVILVDRHASPVCPWMPVHVPVRVLPEGLGEDYDVAIHVDERQWWVLQAMSSPGKRIFYALHDGTLYGKAGAWESAQAPVDAVLANSEWTAERIRSRSSHDPVVVRSGIDAQRFAPATVERRWPLLCVGEERSWKGTEMLRSVAEVMGLQMGELRRLDPPQSRLAEVYSSAEVFLVGSDHEGFGQPGLEALACGVPLVTTDNGGSREYAVDGRTALVVPPGDRDAMVTAVRRLRGDPKLRASLVRAGLEIVSEHYDWDDRASRLESVLTGIMNETTTHPEQSTPATPAISVIVLAWDQLHHTQACVESLRLNTDADHEMIIVDNGSDWDARAYAMHAADVPVLHKENLGFAGGMNSGLAVATAPVVAFVNNDTVFPPGWASPLLESLAGRRSIGIVAPAVSAARNARTVRTEPGSAVELLNPFEAPPAAVVWLMPTATARALGGFDERFFPASGEDVDLAFKVWVNDLDIAFDQRVMIDHVGKGTAASKLPNWRATWRENGERLLDRWTDPGPDIPRLPDVPEDRFERNLRTAAAVAGWMRQYFGIRHRRVPGRQYLEQAISYVDRWRRDPDARHRAAMMRTRLTRGVRQLGSRTSRSTRVGWRR